MPPAPCRSHRPHRATRQRMVGERRERHARRAHRIRLAARTEHRGQLLQRLRQLLQLLAHLLGHLHQPRSAGSCAGHGPHLADHLHRLLGSATGLFRGLLGGVLRLLAAGHRRGAPGNGMLGGTPRVLASSVVWAVTLAMFCDSPILMRLCTSSWALLKGIAADRLALVLDLLRDRVRQHLRLDDGGLHGAQLEPRSRRRARRWPRGRR